MFTYVPERIGRGAPLVVVLHGCGQTAAAHAASAGWIELAERRRFAVLAPEQSVSNNVNRCFNWFVSGDIRRGQGEAASIAEMVTGATQHYGLDSRRVFISGLSAGGAMATVMLATYPELFTGGAIIAGLPYGVATGAVAALRTMRAPKRRTAADLAELIRRAAPAPWKPTPRLTIWHGDADTVVNPANAEDIARQWAAAGGLPQAPDRVIRSPGRTRSIWGSPSGSSPVIELNLIHGLGHGTPLATAGEGAVGSPAPFMLEAGVSSTTESAAFWGLDEPARAEPLSGGDGAVRDVADRLRGKMGRRVWVGVRGLVARLFRTARRS